MKLTFETILVSEVEPFILMLTLHRPEARNAINSKMMVELQQFWHQLNTSTHTIRCIIITGSGDKAFCAGADIKERETLTTEVWMQQHIVLEHAMREMISCNVPIIAAINGAAFGGGLELVLASDFAYASNNATFGQSEVKLGIIPGAMGTQTLPRACGIRRAKELCFTGASFNATEAYQWNIVNKIFTPQELITETLNTARVISQNAPLAVKQAKISTNMAWHTGLYTGYDHEITCYTKTIETNDRKEGINAFIEKRAHKFNGN